MESLGSAAEAAFLKDHQKGTELFEHDLKVMRNLNHRNKQSVLCPSRDRQ